MRLDDPTTHDRHVAVGPSRVDAAAYFGAQFDDVFLTSYKDLGSDVELGEIASFHLVVGHRDDSDFRAAFEAACREVHARDAFALHLAVPEPDAEWLQRLLDQGDLQIEGVRSGSSALTLAVGPRGRSRPGLDGQLLSALEPAPLPPATATPPADAEPPQQIATEPLPRARPSRPRPLLVRLLERVNRLRAESLTRRSTLVVLLGFLVVLVALAVLAYSTPSLANVLAPAGLAVLLAVLLLTSAASCLLVLQLARQVHAQTGRLEKMVLRNRKVVQNRTVALGRRIRALEAGQARLPFAHDYLEAVAEASASSSARLTDLLQALESSGFDPDSHVDLHSNLHLQTQRHVFAEMQLVRLLDLPGRVPPLGGWAASPDFGLLVVQELLRVRPAVAVELGSGATTLLMALAIRQHSLSTRLVALEHRADFKERTEALLADNGVDDLVDVRLAPLGPSSLPDHPTRWYDESALAGLEEIGLVVVDGPPSYTGSRARYPAVPLLAPHFAEQVSILADDTIRDDDLEVVGAWSRQLPDFEVDLLDTLEKHAALLRRR